MATEQHLQILRLAAAGKLPAIIDTKSTDSVEVVQALIAAGHLKAINASSLDRPSFLDPEITISGLEYLTRLEERTRETSLQDKALRRFFIVLKWVFGIIAAVVAAYIIKRFVG